MKIGCWEVPKPSYPPLLWPAEWKAPAPLNSCCGVKFSCPIVKVPWNTCSTVRPENCSARMCNCAWYTVHCAVVEAVVENCSATIANLAQKTAAPHNNKGWRGSGKLNTAFEKSFNRGFCRDHTVATGCLPEPSADSEFLHLLRISEFFRFI